MNTSQLWAFQKRRFIQNWEEFNQAVAKLDRNGKWDAKDRKKVSVLHHKYIVNGVA